VEKMWLSGPMERSAILTMLQQWDVVDKDPCRLLMAWEFRKSVGE
jgi:hypothetical protein